MFSLPAPPVVVDIEPAPDHGFETIAVLGVGLIGGSIAAAAARNGLHVHVWDPDPVTLAQAAARGWTVHDTPALAVAGADLVVLAGPVNTLVDTAALIAASVRPGTVVTDVGSVKGTISVGLAEAFARTGALVVPGHPMAGRAVAGLLAADPDLFDGATWLLAADPADPATRRVATFARGLGARRVAAVDAKTHDVLVSLISHTPQLVASALAAAVGSYGLYPSAARVAGGGFRDTTRIASSPWSMWGPIVAANRAALIAPLTAVRDELDAVVRALVSSNPSHIEPMFTAANAAREIFDNPGAAPTVTADPITNERTTMSTSTDTAAPAWTDRSLGWTTVRTTATDTHEHAVLACAFLAEIAGVAADTSTLVRGNDTIRRIAELVGGEYTSTWTADGFYVQGVTLNRVFYVIP